MKIIWLLSFVVLSILFWIHGSSFLDPDFGMHITTGKWIWERREVPNVDLYSYTRPEHPWKAHEWMAQVFVYLIQDKLGLGFLGLVLMFSVLATLAVWVSLQGKWKIDSWVVWLMAILGGIIIMPYVGARPQVFNWLFLAVELTLVRRLERLFDSENKKGIVGIAAALAILIVLWSNLHGGWTLGVGVLVWISVLSVKLIKKRIDVGKSKFSLALLGVVLMGLVGIQVFNPYGLGVLSETWLTITDSKLRWRIVEWLPMARFDVAFMLFVGLNLAVIWEFGKKLKLWERLGVVLFYLAAMSSNRNIPLMVIFSLPVVCRGLEAIWEVGEKPLAKLRQIKYVVVSAVVVVCAWQIWQSELFSDKYSERRYYPEQAINFIRNQDETARVFNEYGWGGYLIRELPGRRWFIDGRMPSWPGVYEEYEEVILGTEKGEKLLEKYNVELVLWPNNATVKKVGSLSKLVMRVLGKRDETEVRGIEEMLKSLGWVVVYSDPVAQVWRKN